MSKYCWSEVLIWSWSDATFFACLIWVYNICLSLSKNLGFFYYYFTVDLLCESTSQQGTHRWNKLLSILKQDRFNVESTSDTQTWNNVVSTVIQRRWNDVNSTLCANWDILCSSFKHTQWRQQFLIQSCADRSKAVILMSFVIHLALWSSVLGSALCFLFSWVDVIFFSGQPLCVLLYSVCVGLILELHQSSIRARFRASETGYHRP